MGTNSGRFAKLSTDLWTNTKWLVFADSHPRAAIVWVTALSYCADRLTDGYFDRFTALRMFAATPDDLGALESAGFIEKSGDGYVVHDYMEYQSASTDVDELKAKRSAAGRKGMASRWGNRTQSDNKPITSVITNVISDVIDEEQGSDEKSVDTLSKNQQDVGNKKSESITKPITNAITNDLNEKIENIEISAQTDNKNNKPITSVITNAYQTDNKAITDIDIDIDSDSYSIPPIIPPLTKSSSQNRQPLDPKRDVSVFADGSTRQQQFETFWTLYPKKVSKRTAAEAFRHACMRANFRHILARLTRQINDPNKPDVQYWPKPEDWLNGDRWDDDDFPPRRKPQQATQANKAQARLDNNRQLIDQFQAQNQQQPRATQIGR